MNDKENILRILNNYKYSYYKKGDLSIRGYVDDFLILLISMRLILILHILKNILKKHFQEIEV